MADLEQLQARQVERDITNDRFHAYYGPKRRQAHDFTKLASRYGLSDDNAVKAAVQSGAIVKAFETWRGVRFPDGTGFVVQS